jgi:hypothetical protein
MTIINFKVNDNGQIINVSYDGELTCEQFMRDFTKKNTNYESIDQNIYTFKVQTKFLNSDKFKSKKLKEIIREQQIVNFVRKQNMSYSK